MKPALQYIKNILETAIVIAFIEFFVFSIICVGFFLLSEIDGLISDSACDTAFNVFSVIYRYGIIGTTIIFATIIEIVNPAYDAEKRKISESNLICILGELAFERIKELFRFIDCQEMSEKEVNIAKGYFELSYLAISLIELEHKKTIKNRFSPSMIHALLYLSVGADNIDFGGLIYNKESKIQNLFVEMLTDFESSLFNFDYVGLSEQIKSVVGSQAFEIVNSKTQISKVIPTWHIDAFTLSNKFHVTRRIFARKKKI